MLLFVVACAALLAVALGVGKVPEQSASLPVATVRKEVPMTPVSPGSTNATGAPYAEALLVGGGDAAGQGRVVARMDPNIVVLQADARVLPEIARRARFAIIRSPDGSMQTFGDESVLKELDPGAQLFVSGWRTQSPNKKNRPGEGLPWDTPGYEPP